MRKLSEKYLVVIAGPTGAGKSDTAVKLAKKLNTVIISADARQFYKEMHIGTTKPTTKQLKAIKHYFIDSLSIHDSYDAGKYESDVLQLLGELFRDEKVVLLAGGSGLFIDAVIKGLDILPPTSPEIRTQLELQLKKEGIQSLQKLLKEKDPAYYKKADIQNPRRLIRALEVCLFTGKSYSSFRKNKPAKRNFNVIRICLSPEKDELYQKINKRVDALFKEGLVEEAKQLFPLRKLNALHTVGYSELFDHFENKFSLEEARELIKQHTRNYAKRQLTWFRKDPSYTWFHPDETDKILEHILAHMKISAS